MYFISYCYVHFKHFLFWFFVLGWDGQVYPSMHLGEKEQTGPVHRKANTFNEHRIQNICTQTDTHGTVYMQLSLIYYLIVM